MALDTNILYGEMAGSFIMHWAIPFAISLFPAIILTMLRENIVYFVLMCVAASFICQALFLLFLQMNACGGVNDIKNIVVGALIAAGITGGMVAIPVFVEPMRLVVSQLFMKHKTLLTPELALIKDKLTKSLLATTGEEPLASHAAIEPEEYAIQTFQEIASGASFWSAFAGAYGIGIGSLFAAKCHATS